MHFRTVQDAVFYIFSKNVHLSARFYLIHSKQVLDILLDTGSILTQKPQFSGDAAVLAGILPFMTLIQKLLQKPLFIISDFLNIQPDSVISMILSLANILTGCIAFLISFFLAPVLFGTTADTQTRISQACR